MLMSVLLAVKQEQAQSIGVNNCHVSCFYTAAFAWLAEAAGILQSTLSRFTGVVKSFADFTKD